MRYIRGDIFSTRYTFPADTPHADAAREALKARDDKARAAGQIIIVSIDRWCVNTEQKVFINHIDCNGLTNIHTHDYYELNYVFRGTLYEVLDDTFHVFPAGTLLIMSPAICHSVLPDDDCEAINILVERAYFEDLVAKTADAHPDCGLARVTLDRRYAVFDTKGCPDVHAIISDLYDKNGYSQIKTNSYRMQLLLTLMRALILTLTLSEEKGEVACTDIGKSAESTYDTAIEILRYIRAHYNTVTLEDVCAHFRCSPSFLTRTLRKTYGLSFKTCVMEQKYNHAANLLTRTAMPLKEVCQTVGFDYAYFVRSFKRVRGLTPLQFRKKYAGDLSSFYPLYHPR